MVDKKVSAWVYTPANMNAIDGSSVWVQSIVLALAGVRNVEVTLMLSHRVTNERLLSPLRHSPAIEIVEPNAKAGDGTGVLNPEEAAHRLRRSRAHVVVVRGTEAAHRLAKEPPLQGRLWPYLTDIPQRSEDLDDTWRDKMRTIMNASPLLLCQTDELRSYVEANFPEVAGKGVVFPPVIPGDIEPNIVDPPTRANLRLCYAGKFARAWNTYEMCDLPAQLAERGIEARITMVGDKINQDFSWPEFPAAMREKLETAPGVDWVGGVSRQQSIAHIASAHIGLSWRSKELDDSLELSTKLLEYCAAGTPPILNRTAMHERIFGEDYPLFVDPEQRVLELLVTMTERPEIYEAALGRTTSLAADYTVEKASERLADLIHSPLVEDARSSSRWRSWVGGTRPAKRA